MISTTISEFAISKIGCGYVYGATGWICTPEHRRQQAEQYPEQRRNCLVVAAKWDGTQCYDCAQLVKAAAKQAGISLPSGATSQWNSDVWQEKSTLPAALQPDTIVFRQDKSNPKRMAHVGIYVGNGFVVEAKGASCGVVKTEFSAGNWTHCAALKEAGGRRDEVGGKVTDTENNCSKRQKFSVSGNVNAIVTAQSGSTVNLRDEPGGKVLMRVPIGASVLAAEEQTWVKIAYGGKTGWMQGEFLSKK